MGLFNRRSKKDKKSVDELAEKANKLIDSEKAEAEEETKEKVEAETSESKNLEEEKDVEEKTENKDRKESLPEEKSADTSAVRRFTILIEDVFKMKDDKGLIVGGNVHGTVNVHDKVYILHPVLPQGIEAEIDAIEEGPMNMVETATDSRVGIRFESIKDQDAIPVYAVVTNIRPQAVPNPKYPAESPYLLGLSYEYGRLIKNTAFANIFTFAVFSGHYITPVRLEIDTEKSSEGKAVLKQNSQISFRLLPHPANDKLMALPVFTDWAALKKWDNAFKGEDQPKTFFMSFEQCADIGLKNGGVVINAFGPAPIFVSNENIKGILQMKANLDKKIDEEKKKENQ